MATIPQIAALFETTLAAKITSSDSAMTLVSGTDKAGNTLSGTYGFIVDEGTATEEFVLGSVSGTAVTSMTRGLDPQNPNSSVAALKFEHRRGATVKITDYPFSGEVYRLLNGTDTFPNPLKYAGSVAPSTADDLADKGYVDSVAIAGGADASTTTKGISKASVAPASATSPIFVGDNDPRVPTQGENDGLAATTTPATTNKFVTQRDLQIGAELYAADSVGTDAYAITLSPAPIAYNVAMTLRFKAGTTNTGTATLNVNALGAKTIKKNYNQTLADGDIVANQIVVVTFDVINDCWQMLSQIANTGVTYKNGTTTKDSADASTTQTIAHGLSVTPKFIRITAACANGSQPPSLATTVYNGTTQSSVSYYTNNATPSFTSGNTFTLNTAGNSGTQSGVVTFDSTNISIVWTKTGGPTGIYTMLWEAYA